MHVAFDLDDLILDHHALVARALRTEFGVDLPAGDWQDRDAATPDGRKIWGPELMGHFTDSESWLKDRDWVWALAEPIEGALGGLRTLRREGHYLEIVTAKPEWAEWVTWRWIGRWRPPVQRVTIVPLFSNKAEATDAMILFDDSPRNVEDFQKSGRGAFLFTRPHNVILDTTDVYHSIRVKNWDEVVARVREINDHYQG